MHVIINGVSSETLQGVQVLSLPPITKPRMRTSVAVIDGRPGDIVTRLGYEAYNRKIRILLHHDYDIDAISAFFNTSGKIIFSNEPDMEYEFETIDAFSFERAVRYKTADITFHVQPYKLSATEEPATGEVSTLVDKTPYIIRRTPFGTRQKGTIVGGSIVWNQLCNNASVTVANGHKYLLEKDDAYSIGASTGTALTGLTAGSDMVFDLTIMFGPTIADYIYTQEQATAGAGVALAKAWAGITADYYPYDAGSIKSVTGLTAHSMTGFNQFDDSILGTYGWTHEADGSWSCTSGSAYSSKDLWENTFGYIGQICFTMTYKYGSSGLGMKPRFVYTDGTYDSFNPTTSTTYNTVTYVSNANKTIAYIRTTYGSSGIVTYWKDVCINFSSSRNGQYEPHVSYSYPLDSSLTLRGIPKLDGDSIYYDGDIYKADGTVTRRYKLDDLATITWQKRKTGTVNDGYSAALSSAYKAINGDYVPPFLCDKYEAIGATNANLLTTNVDTMEVGLYGFRYNGNTTVVYLVVPTGSTISGNLVYELAEPTTEQAEPYTALQICDPNGTEEWVGASIPVGHDTTYIDPISMTVTNEGNTESAPSITIEGEGAVEVTVDGLNILQIQMPASGEITIDSRTLDATDGEGGLANRSVTGDYNDLRLAPGEHTVTVTGDVTSVTLKNTSRWI